MTDVALASHQEPAAAFSYASLDPKQAAVARGAADAIRDIHKHAIPAIGRHLMAAKEALPHGAFTAWAEQELGISSRSVRNYVQAARWLAGKAATVAVLPPTVLYGLSAPGVPDELVQEVLTDAASGKALNPAAIQARLTAAKVEQAELRAEQRRKPGLNADELRIRRRRREARAASLQARSVAKSIAAEQQRVDRLRPLADEVRATLGPGLVGDLVTVLFRWDDRATFLELLHAAAGKAS